MRMGESSEFGMSMGSGPATPDQIGWFSVACLRMSMALAGSSMARKAVRGSNAWRFGTMAYAGWDWARWRASVHGTIEDESVAGSSGLVFRGLLSCHALNNSDFDARLKAWASGRIIRGSSLHYSAGQSEVAQEIHAMNEAGLRWTGSGLEMLGSMFELPQDAQDALWSMGLQESLASAGVLSESLELLDAALAQCGDRVIQVQSITMNPFKSVDLGEQKVQCLIKARTSLERQVLDAQSNPVQALKRSSARL